MIGTVQGNEEAVRLANDAYREGTRITENFAQSIATQNAEVSQAQAQWEDFKITVGSRLQQVFRQLLTTMQQDLMPVLKSFADWLENSDQAAHLFGETLPNAIKFFGDALYYAGKGLAFLVELIEKAGTIAGAAFGKIDEVIQDVLFGLEKLEQAFQKIFQNQTIISWFEKLTDKIYGVEEALETKSLTPALIRYQEQALRAGLVTKDLAQNMSAMGAQLTAPETALLNLSSKLANLQGIGRGVDPSANMAITAALRRQQFQSAEALQIGHYQQGSTTQTQPITHVTNINFSGNNVIDEQTLGSFVRKITEVQTQQQDLIIGSLA